MRPRVPREVRDEVFRYAGRRRREGAAWSVIARETGLEVRKLQRWSGRARPAASVPVLRPVEVVQEPEPLVALTLIAPSGVARASRCSGQQLIEPERQRQLRAMVAAMERVAGSVWP